MAQVRELEVRSGDLSCGVHLLAYPSERADSLVGWGMALGLDTQGQCAVPKVPASLLRDRQQAAASLPWDKWPGSKQTWPQDDHTVTVHLSLSTGEQHVAGTRGLPYPGISLAGWPWLFPWT